MEKFYIARDKDLTIKLYSEKPYKSEEWWVGNTKGNAVMLPEKSYPEVKWKDYEPYECTKDDMNSVKMWMLNDIERLSNSIVKRFNQLDSLGLDGKKYSKQFDEIFSSKTKVEIDETSDGNDVEFIKIGYLWTN